MPEYVPKSRPVSGVPVDRHQAVGLQVLQFVTAFVLQMLELGRRRALGHFWWLLARTRKPTPKYGPGS